MMVKKINELRLIAYQRGYDLGKRHAHAHYGKHYARFIARECAGFLWRKNATKGLFLAGHKGAFKEWSQ